MPAQHPTLRPRVLAFVTIATATGLGFIDFCNLVFQCGCRSIWSGGDTHCNIHAASPPHCPWCMDAWSGPLVLGVVIITQAAVLLAPGKLGTLHRSLFAVAALPLVGGTLAIAFGLGRGYWNA